jgi:hypothetical protein
MMFHNVTVPLPGLARSLLQCLLFMMPYGGALASNAGP